MASSTTQSDRYILQELLLFHFMQKYSAHPSVMMWHTVLGYML
uniref:Uncharacterized protein n=1 Tax=Arundo donax TaxID=35708 RepID=A0A0A8ZZR5_ARUDO